MRQTFVEIIYSICDEEKLEMKSISSNWIFRIKKDGKCRHIFGYRFEINSGVSESICNDKAAASQLLEEAGIPCVKHILFNSPKNAQYVASEGNWKLISNIFKDNNEKIVCKPNEGTGGDNVYLVDNQITLEKVLDKIFKKARTLVISPYYEIEDEYRVVMLDGEAKVVFKKNIPYVIGDGKSNVLQLLGKSPKEHKIKELSAQIPFYEIPLKGEAVKLNWRHNLGLGASAEIIKDEKLIGKLSDIAKKAVEAVHINFATVDIISTNNELMVLEVNRGVMMVNFASMNDEYYNIAKEIYREAILKMFEWKN